MTGVGVGPGLGIVGRRPFVNAPETSLYFAGGGERLGLGNVLGFERTDAFTIIQDIKTAGTNSGPIGKVSGGAAKGWFFFVSASSGDVLQFSLRAVVSTNELRVTSAAAINTGKWVRVAVSYLGDSDATTVRMGIDGALESPAVQADTLTSSIVHAAELQIGDFASGVAPFGGNIGVTAIYNRALTDAEIAAIGPASQWFDHKNGLYRANLVGLWVPDDLSGTTVPDSSPSGNDATMAGGMVAENLARDSPHIYTPGQDGTDLVAAWEPSEGRSRYTLNGSDFSAISDLSGKLHTATQGTAADQGEQVTINGVIGIDYDASNTEFMSLAAMAETGNDYTIIAVLDERSVVTALNQTMLSSVGSGGTALAATALDHAANTMGAFDGATGETGPAAFNGLQYQTWVFDAAGGNFEMSQDDNAPTVKGTYNGTSRLNGAANWGRYTGATNYMDATVLGLYVWRGILSAPRLALAKAYAAALVARATP